MSERDVSTQPVGLYVHIPFCRRRCHYCDFTVRVGVEASWDQYVDALIRDLRGWSSWLSGRRLHSIYFGGGTPTLIGAERLQRVLETIRDSFALEPDCEVTLEANPETVTQPLLDSLVQSGMNRLSMGVQSFQPEFLECLNRQHDEADVANAVRWARQAGIDNLSLDLIYGIPGQNLDHWKQDLEKVADLEPQHVSAYELTLEPETPMGRKLLQGLINLPGEDEIIAMFEWTAARLGKLGFEHYEISNYALPGRRCIHNDWTWKQGEYLGVGLAAYSHLMGCRFRATRSLEGYLSSEPTLNVEEPVGYHDLRWLTPLEKWSEALILGLRTSDGVSIQELENRIGSSIPESLLAVLNRYMKTGLLLRDQQCLKLSPKGLLLSDSLFEELVL